LLSGSPVYNYYIGLISQCIGLHRTENTAIIHTLVLGPFCIYVNPSSEWNLKFDGKCRWYLNFRFLFDAVSKSKEAKCEVNLKKYKSLEDLQPELPLPETSQPDQVCSVTPQTGTSFVVRPSTAGVSRICGGNESFRAAVDRSYDGTDSELMETGYSFYYITYLKVGKFKIYAL